MKYFIGIDPGISSGSICIASEDFQTIKFIDIKEEQEVCDITNEFGQAILTWTETTAALERVSASPQMGSVSAFSFGRGFGRLEALLCAWQIPFRTVAPQKWQQAISTIPFNKPRAPSEDIKQVRRDLDKRKREVKSSVYEFVSKIFPHADLTYTTDKGRKAKDFNKSDALAIAYWLSTQHD